MEMLSKVWNWFDRLEKKSKVVVVFAVVVVCLAVAQMFK